MLNTVASVSSSTSKGFCWTWDKLKQVSTMSEPPRLSAEETFVFSFSSPTLSSFTSTFPCSVDVSVVVNNHKHVYSCHVSCFMSLWLECHEHTRASPLRRTSDGLQLHQSNSSSAEPRLHPVSWDKDKIFMTKMWDRGDKYKTHETLSICLSVYNVFFVVYVIQLFIFLLLVRVFQREQQENTTPPPLPPAAPPPSYAGPHSRSSEPAQVKTEVTCLAASSPPHKRWIQDK